MGQLKSATVSNVGASGYSISYVYGKDGNIESLTIGGQTTHFGYDGDLLTSIGGDLLAWNSNGNLDNSVTASFTYDFDNKLRFATADSNSIEIRYDPRGNRIYKGIRDSEGDIIKERKYIVDIVGKLPVILCEIDPNNSSLTNKYYYANSQILAQDAAYLTDPNDPNSTDYNRYYYLHDRLGSVRQVVDCNALTVATYTYNPYGEDFVSDCNDVNIYNPFKYTGQWYDSEIAQYYLRARQYDPQLMRFGGRDPVKGNPKKPMSLHQYLYCHNNPLSATDPSGKLAGNIMAGLNNMAAVNAEVINLATYSVSTGDDKFFALAMQAWSINFILGMEGLVEGVPLNVVGVAKSVITGMVTGGLVDGFYGNYKMGSRASNWLMTSGGYAIFQACMRGFQWTSGISDEEMDEFNEWNTK